MVEGHPNIKMANSIIDYVFRALGMEYLDRTDLVQVPPKEVGELPEPPSGVAVDAGLQLELPEELPSEAPISRPAATTEPAPAANGSAAPSNGTNGQSTNGTRKTVAVAMAAETGGDTQTASVQQALGDMMGDAPLCDTCGHITVRNGSCYRCLNCGNSMGCS